MDPAPGYDPLVPHDLLHMVVEAELGLTKGVFGQLASGGDAGTFSRDLEPDEGTRAQSRRRRKTKTRGAKLLEDGSAESAQSERASFILWYEWLARSALPERTRLAARMASQAQEVRDTCPPAEINAFTEDLVGRVRSRLDQISDLWSHLGVGEAIEVSWPGLRARGVD
jgi:hypothetical protein